MLTKSDFFKCLHIENNIKNRLRHQGKLINAIIIDQHDPSTCAGDILVLEEDSDKSRDAIIEEYVHDSKAFISTSVRFTRSAGKNSIAPEWIEVNSEEIEVLYQQAVAKSGPVDENDLGTLIVIA